LEDEKKMSPPLPAFLLLISIAFTSASVVPLQPGFYAETCPEAEFIVKDVMRRNMIREPRSAASVMRFQFHDCFVNVNFDIYTKNFTHASISTLHFFFLTRILIRLYLMGSSSSSFSYRVVMLLCCSMTHQTC
jgi:hypothetical protein